MCIFESCLYLDYLGVSSPLRRLTSNDTPQGAVSSSLGAGVLSVYFLFFPSLSSYAPPLDCTRQHPQVAREYKNQGDIMAEFLSVCLPLIPEYPYSPDIIRPHLAVFLRRPREVVCQLKVFIFMIILVSYCGLSNNNTKGMLAQAGKNV